ncbi:MAG TPA: peptidoglycan-binding domain-containing protein [Streptosporangiaceae bacterium]
MARRRTAAVAGAVVAGAVAVAGGAWAAAGGTSGSAPDKAPERIATSTAAVVRTDVAQRELVNGTLSHSGSYDVLAPGGQGVITKLPAEGAVIGRGASLYEVNGDPVPLFYGARPPWRPFAAGMTDGPDVRELERNLIALGYGAGVTPDRHFSNATYWAVRRWQHAAGLPVTGSVPLGQVVFLPGPLRVAAHDAKIGSPVHGGAPIEHGTSSIRTVEAQLDPSLAPNVKKGDRVTVTMPDGSPLRGRITRVSAVAVNQQPQGDQPGAPTQALIPITISLDRPRGGAARVLDGALDQAQVQIAITSELHRHVLAVPILALLARPGGAYEVVVVGAGGVRQRVPVRPGLFDETGGLVEVDGQGLAAGQRVEVPDDRS